MTNEELQKILDDHKLRLLDDTKGQRANLYGANLYGADLRGADLRGANLYGANLYGANLSDADLRGANLSDADLRGAYLGGADLRGADLRGANLSSADLRGINLSNTCTFTFTLGAHFGFAHFGEQYEDGSYVKIGCEGHSLEHWLENYEEIGKSNGYTDKQIKDYGDFLKYLSGRI